MYIKLCGITNKEDALFASGLDIEALGFNFFKPSPRCIEPDYCQQIISMLPKNISKVGIFVNESLENIKTISSQCALDTIQLHGEESPDFCRKLSSYKIFKAIRIAAEEDLGQMTKYEVEAFLLDTKIAGQYGGTGKPFNWELAIKAKDYGSIILSGGLTADNVEKAIRKVKPYGVDVASGVEVRPGKKDNAKMEAFVKRVRELES
ncbi:MAG: phosphoribosylanthranilate isomerase [Actinobacteria bacterium]|nr:MAG: phosphoribosylanthranilate isomerase [Actinomycetota bacterium]